MKTVIMAGGKGTRISGLFPNMPKPMIPISTFDKETGSIIERPILEWEIRSLAEQGFKDLIITVSHMAKMIIDYFGNGAAFGVDISYYFEETPLGNAGALYKMKEQLGAEPFLLLNADAVFDVDFNRMVAYHKEKGGLVTIFTHPNSHPYDSSLIVTGNDDSVIRWLTKEDERPKWYKNRVNAGLHVLDPKVLEMSEIDEESIGKKGYDGKVVKIDLDRHILKPLCGTGMMFAYYSPEYVKDMGTPERYEAVCRDFQNGLISSKNLLHPQKAIFLDRDGTINRYVGFLRNIDDFELLPDVADAIKQINSTGYLCIVVTNQPVIARGEMTLDELDCIHQKMETLLGKEGAYIDAIYYCPHHPDRGFEGEIPELKTECNCRKPKPGMLIRAAEFFNIELSNSWMIGDGDRDVLAGKNAGCKTIKIIDNEDIKKDKRTDYVIPDVYAVDLFQAVRMIEALDQNIIH